MFLQRPSQFRVYSYFLFVRFLFTSFMEGDRVITSNFSRRGEYLRYMKGLLTMFNEFMFVRQFPLMTCFPFNAQGSHHGSLRGYTLTTSKQTNCQRGLTLFRQVTSIVRGSFTIQRGARVFRFRWYRFLSYSFVVRVTSGPSTGSGGHYSN